MRHLDELVLNVVLIHLKSGRRKVHFKRAVGGADVTERRRFQFEGDQGESVTVDKIFFA